jgi:hypothetical protein
MKISDQKFRTLNQWLGESDLLKHARLSGSPSENSLIQTQKSWVEIKQICFNRPVDLIEILSQAMPIRYGVWWGMLCGVGNNHFANCGLSANCISTILEWIFQTDENHRLKVRAAAESTDWKMPEGLLARAVAWSAGSILPETVPVFLPAPEGVTGQMIAGSVLSFAAQNTTQNYNDILSYFISLGEEVASGMLLPDGWHRQNMQLGNSSNIFHDLSPIEIPGNIDFG